MPDFLSGLAPPEQLSSRPLEGKTVGVIRETLGQGVDPGVEAAVRGALSHLEQLGATIKEVRGSTAASQSLITWNDGDISSGIWLSCACCLDLQQA